MISQRAEGQATIFTFQGRLTDAGSPATNVYDMEFKLFDKLDVGTGTQLGLTITKENVGVTTGIFTVELDFGVCAACFNGEERFLEIGIKPAGNNDPFTVLSPRQAVRSAPYALRAFDAGQLEGIASGGFIQNRTTQQAMTNFNISGNGTASGTLSANTVNAASQYNIGGLRMLAVSGPFNDGFGTVFAASNTFLGESAGANTMPSNMLSSTIGKFNTFAGLNAGVTNTTGRLNSFFGERAGNDNVEGSENSFFGSGAGSVNTFGNQNSLFGRFAGASITTGSNSTIIGSFADVVSGDLTNATAIGSRARADFSNSLVLGSVNGVNGATATVNVGIGTTAPQHRLDVSGAINTSTQYNIEGLRVLDVSGPFNTGMTIIAASNTFVGENAGVNTTPDPAPGLPEGKLNTFMGANAGAANTTGSDNSFFGTRTGRANTTGTDNSFFGAQTGQATTTGGDNSFFGVDAGFNNTTGEFNSFFGRSAGFFNTGGGNSFFGFAAGDFNTTGSDNTIIGRDADVLAGDLTNATAIGARARVSQSDSLVLGSINGVGGATATVNVGIGITSPADRLHVNGIIRVETLGAAGATDVCRNGLDQLSTCSSSLRYKERVARFASGLELIDRLRPITFTWKQGGMRDVGFAAEEVAEVEPLLVTHNTQGQIEGVKYDRITTALVNAVKQQQQIIKRQQEELSQQQTQIESLKRAVCQVNPNADICK
jgi:hypothetical protein